MSAAAGSGGAGAGGGRPLAGPTLPVLGGKVVLTALREEDIDRVVEACTTEQAQRWLDTPWPYARADAEGFVREFAPAGWRGSRGMPRPPAPDRPAPERPWGCR